ncbi:MAG: sugar phosphate isomerase/epimerase [Patescibacteria group bacterium]|nr:sugar phosphate isomerase/epimerase [Patescibacteria group bacterium]
MPEKKTIFDKIIVSKLSKQNIFYNENSYDIFKNFKKSGVDGIELLISSNATKADIRKVQKIFRKNDLPILSIHQSLTTLFNIRIQEITRLFEFAQLLSAKIVVLHLSAISKYVHDKNFISNLKNLEKKYKINIGIENNPKHPLSLFKRYTWEEKNFSTLVGEKGFKITFDTTHLAQTGGDILNFYKINKDRIINIHLSDYRKNFTNKYLLLTKDTHLTLGEGELPIVNFLKQLRKDNYKGHLTMEINSNLDGLCFSAKFVKNIFK